MKNNTDLQRRRIRLKHAALEAGFSTMKRFYAHLGCSRCHVEYLCKRNPELINLLITGLKLKSVL